MLLLNSSFNMSVDKQLLQAINNAKLTDFAKKTLLIMAAIPVGEVRSYS
jgi:O6-methylguanine-DNA--protein-cysteine methyltransferase